MIDPTLAVALNNQYNFERFSSAVYIALAAHFDFLNLVGMAHYMFKRAEEERSHAEKFLAYITDRNIKPVVDALPRPEEITESAVLKVGMVCFQKALEHERNVTGRIEALSALSLQMDDLRTQEFTHWFLKEQVEEEKSLEEIITRFNLAIDNGAAILLLDHELGEK